MVRYCGEAHRLPGLFPTPKSFFEAARSSITRGLQGVANVFTQHRPLLASLLDQYSKGKLSDADFPFVTSPAKQPYGLTVSRRCGLRHNVHHTCSLAHRAGNVVVFIVGGATFSEAAVVHELNAAPGPRFLLAAPLFLNTAGFITELNRLRRVEEGRTT